MKRFFQKSCCFIVFAVLLGLSAGPAFGLTLQKGPYLLFGGNNTEMQLLWQNDAASQDRIEWGVDQTYLSGNTLSSEYGAAYQHKYLLTNLTPGTKYYYRVTVGGTPYTGSFYAAPAAGATALKFLAYGDTRTYPSDHNRVSGRINATYAADPAYQTLLIAVGDLVNSDTESYWTSDYFPLGQLEIRKMLANVPMSSSIGNHEGTGALFRKYFPYPYGTGRFYWSFDYGPAHFAVVDEYASYAPGSAQYTWLENDLRSSTKPWKFVYLHEPGWSAAGGHPNNADVQTYIQPLCERYGVPILFAGHNHYYARAVTYRSDNNAPLHHVTTGGGGAPLGTPISTEPNIVAASRSYHFCKINIVNNDELQFQAIDDGGAIIDQFTVKRTPAIAISDLQAGNITSGSATITWTTNLSSSSTVEYGLHTGYGSTATGAGGVTGHGRDATVAGEKRS